MQERIDLLKAEVESRGSSWLEFQSAEEVESKGEEALVNGTGEADGHGDGEATEAMSSAWTDGTFQTGRIVNGEVRMDEAPRTNGTTNQAPTGGRFDDDALRRAIEERMRALAEEGDDEGMHL
jgi:hypothetical protein